MKFRILILLMFIWMVIGYPAFAGTAKVFLYKSYITAANFGGDPAIDVFSSSTDQSGSGTALTLNTNYTIDTNAMYQGTEPSIAIDISNCPADAAYILLKGTDRYAIVGASTPAIPGADQTPGITSYLLGKPDAPIVADNGIVAGFETAQVTWTTNPNYNYNAVYFKLSKSPDLSNPIQTKSQDYNSVSPPYAFGEYVDGRKLDSGATYFIGLWATVAGVPASDYSKNAGSTAAGVNVLVFKTKSGGAGGAADVTYYLSKEANSTGINTISIPFIVNDVVNSSVSLETQPNVYVPLGAETSGSYTVQDLISTINLKAGGGATPVPVVTVFGWWDEANQQHVGFTSIPASGDLATASATGRRNPTDPASAYSAADIMGMALKTDRPYQVTVVSPVTFTLKGYK